MKTTFFTIALSMTVLCTSLSSEANRGLNSHLLKEAQNYLQVRNIKLSNEKNPLDISCSESVTDEQCLQGLMNLADAAEVDARILTKNRAITISNENSTADAYYVSEFNFKSSGQELTDFYVKELESVNLTLDLEKLLQVELGINLWSGSNSSAAYLRDLKELKAIGANNKIVGEIRIFDTYKESELHPYGAKNYIKGSGPSVVFLKSGFVKEELSKEILEALKGIN